MSVVSVPERMRISAGRYQKMVATGVCDTVVGVAILGNPSLQTARQLI